MTGEELHAMYDNVVSLAYKQPREWWGFLPTEQKNLWSIFILKVEHNLYYGFSPQLLFDGFISSSIVALPAFHHVSWEEQTPATVHVWTEFSEKLRRSGGRMERAMAEEDYISTLSDHEYYIHTGRRRQ